MNLNPGPLTRAAAPTPATAPPVPPLTVQGAMLTLNEIISMEEAEVRALVKLRDHLRESLHGPVPTEADKAQDTQHHPLDRIPAVLAALSSQRRSLMDDIAVMLGAV